MSSSAYVLQRGKGMLFLGRHGQCSALLHSAVLHALEAGSGDAFWIDGCNGFEPYSAVYMAEEERVLQRILVARAFTAHQLHAIALSMEKRCSNAAIIAVSGLAELFFGDVEWNEGRDMLSTSTAALVSTARRAGCWLLLSTGVQEALHELEGCPLRICEAGQFTDVSVEGDAMVFQAHRGAQSSLAAYGVI